MSFTVALLMNSKQSDPTEAQQTALTAVKNSARLDDSIAYDIDTNLDRFLGKVMLILPDGKTIAIYRWDEGVYSLFHATNSGWRISMGDDVP